LPVCVEHVIAAVAAIDIYRQHTAHQPAGRRPAAPMKSEIFKRRERPARPRWVSRNR
jgi:hypothetical protein